MRAGQRDELSTLARMRAVGFFPLTLVALALLALAVVPVVQQRRLNAMEDGIVKTLDEIRSLGQELMILQARKMARFQAYLLSGDRRLAEAYRQLRTREEGVYEQLRNKVEQADTEAVSRPAGSGAQPWPTRLRAELADFHTASQEWQVAHEGEGGPLASEEGRLSYLDLLAAEQQRYSRVLEASEALETVIAEEVEAARTEMREARSNQVNLSIALALLALGATLAVGVIGRRLGELATEAQGRRADALRARRQMQAVLEASADGVVGMDLEGRCTSLNRTGSALLGRPEHDAQGRSVHELLHGRAPPEQAHDAAECPVLLALDSGQEKQEPEDVIWRRDGTSFPARWHLRPLVDGREVRGGVLTLSDMTDVREAEEALRRALRARDEMVAVVSHDLRNPLGTVSAAADLLVELPLPEEQRDEQVQVIRRAAGRMNRLIQDLLDVARIEANALFVDPSPVAVEPLVEETVALFEGQARMAGIELIRQLDPSLPRIRAERGRMEQVLSNLLGNALKFTPRGGEVVVRAAAVEDHVRISVEDTGQGIEPDALAHLFDRFWQMDTGGRRGAGLGLTIVQGIVQAHGGRVEVESEPGEGSAFHVQIPALPDGADEGSSA